MAIAMKEWNDRVEMTGEFVEKSNATEMENLSLASGVSSRVFGNKIPVVNVQELNGELEDLDKEFDKDER